MYWPWRNTASPRAEYRTVRITRRSVETWCLREVLPLLEVVGWMAQSEAGALSPAYLPWTHTIRRQRGQESLGSGKVGLVLVPEILWGASPDLQSTQGLLAPQRCYFGKDQSLYYVGQPLADCIRFLNLAVLVYACIASYILPVYADRSRH